MSDCELRRWFCYCHSAIMGASAFVKLSVVIFMPLIFGCNELEQCKPGYTECSVNNPFEKGVTHESLRHVPDWNKTYISVLESLTSDDAYPSEPATRSAINATACLIVTGLTQIADSPLVESNSLSALSLSALRVLRLGRGLIENIHYAAKDGREEEMLTDLRALQWIIEGLRREDGVFCRVSVISLETKVIHEFGNSSFFLSQSSEGKRQFLAVFTPSYLVRTINMAGSGVYRLLSMEVNKRHELDTTHRFLRDAIKALESMTKDAADLPHIDVTTAQLEEALKAIPQSFTKDFASQYLYMLRRDIDLHKEKVKCSMLSDTPGSDPEKRKRMIEIPVPDSP